MDGGGAEDHPEAEDKLASTPPAQAEVAKTEAEDVPNPLPELSPSSGLAKLEEGHGGAGASIKVAVRIRPFNEREAEHAAGTRHALEAIDNEQIVARPQDGYLKQERTFGYDHVLSSVDKKSPGYASQADVFELVGNPIVENAFNAFNGCLLAYGQTGSGKSYSVLGSGGGEERGVLPRACEEVFEQIARRRLEAEEMGLAMQATVLVSYLEIYQEKIHDLLTSSNTDLQVRIHPVLGPHVPSLTESPVTSMNQVQELLDFGSKNRIVAATLMNAQSSRSHAVFTLELRLSLAGKEQQSKIHFVDLAGSEKQKKTDTEGQRLHEGIAINQSLTILSRCIMALSVASSAGAGGAASRRKSMVTQAPFRESKLTLLLKEALSGNSKTALIACISPSTMNLEESLSTLDFASRCKLIKTSAKKNEQSKADLVESLAAEKRIVEAQLQQQLEQQRALQEQLELELQQSRESQERARAMEKEKHAIELQLRLLELSSQAEAAEEDAAPAKRAAMQRRSADATLTSGSRDQEEELRRAKEQQQAVLHELRRDQERWEEERQRELEQQRGLAQEAERQRLEREHQVEAAERARREILEQLEQARKQQEQSTAEWASAQQQSEQRANQLEELLKHQEVDREERDRLGSELHDVQRELQSAREAMQRSQQEAERGCQQREEELKKLEEERLGAEAQVRELREAQEHEQRKWEALLAEKQSQEEKLQQAREAAAERAARECAEVVERLQREKAEALRRVETEHGETVAQLQARLAEMEQTDRRRRKTVTESRAREEELEGKVEVDMQRHAARIEELHKEMRGLQALSDSWAAQRQDLEARAQEQRRDRERMFKELGIAGVDADATETRHVPRLVNLHPDPMLEGCLVYYLRRGDTHMGADVQSCGVRLSGLGMLGKVCTITNQDDMGLTIRASQDELVRVNGDLVSGAGQELRDGDRLAIGRLHAFRAVVPNARQQLPSELEAREREFDRAMSELETCALDARWRRRVEAAVLMAKAEFGTNEACQLMKRAVAASEAIAEADALIRSALAAAPASAFDMYAPVHELVVLFEADALPRVCVVCRRAGLDEALAAALPHGPAGGTSSSGASASGRFPSPRAGPDDVSEAQSEKGQRAGSGGSAGPFRPCSSSLWEATRFSADRLPWLRKVAEEAAAAAAAREQAAAAAQAAAAEAAAAPAAGAAAASAAPGASAKAGARRRSSTAPGSDGRRQSRRSSARRERDEDLLWFCASDRHGRQSSSWFWCCGSGRPGRG